MYWKKHVSNWLWPNFLHYYYPQFSWGDWGKPWNTSKQPASGPRIQPNSLKYVSSLQQQHLFTQDNFININNFMICNAHIKMTYWNFTFNWKCNIWGKWYNREFEELYNEPNVVNIIKSSRQRWAGHDVRMHENELPKNILWTNPADQWGHGRQKSRWIDGIEEDTSKLACRNWLADAQDRGRWQHLLEDAKAVEQMMMIISKVHKNDCNIYCLWGR